MGNTKPRIYVAGGFSSVQNMVLDSIECFIAHTGQWQTLKEKLTVPRLQASMIVQGEKLYIVGGRSMEETLDSVDIYDRIAQKIETTEGKLNEPKTESCLITFEGNIYCIGGKGCTTVEVMEVVDKVGKWRLIGRLDRPRVGMQCVVYQPV